MTRTNGKRGFTLIELLVVVGMIALITGAVSTSLSSAMRRARIQKATSEVKMISQAILAYENYDRNNELETMTRKQADRTSLAFLLGSAGKSQANTDIPVLLQAALSAQGVMRDPWGQPYLITIRKGNITPKSLTPTSIETGYRLQNFYNLSEAERK